jgi:hypothetical protein
VRGSPGHSSSQQQTPGQLVGRQREGSSTYECKSYIICYVDTSRFMQDTIGTGLLCASLASVNAHYQLTSSLTTIRDTRFSISL